jgi:nitronate monooxygenase
MTLNTPLDSSFSIGKHSTHPLIQGAMGLRVSGGSLAGHVALNGGIGVIATAGIGAGIAKNDGSRYVAGEVEAIHEELTKAYRIDPDGVIGVNIMVADTNFLPGLWSGYWLWCRV